jgi:hypothetical protein
MSDGEDREEGRTPPHGGMSRREPLGYYYDDGTGYEVYDPEGDEEEDETAEPAGNEENAPAGG